MPDLGTLERVVLHHEWESLDEWVSGLVDLADLSDEAIEGLVADQDP